MIDADAGAEGRSAAAADMGRVSEWLADLVGDFHPHQVALATGLDPAQLVALGERGFPCRDAPAGSFEARAGDRYPGELCYIMLAFQALHHELALTFGPELPWDCGVEDICETYVEGNEVDAPAVRRKWREGLEALRRGRRDPRVLAGELAGRNGDGPAVDPEPPRDDDAAGPGAP